MATENQVNRTARLLLDAGTDPDGNVKTVNLAMPRISKNAAHWDADKFIAIAAALAPVLSKTLEGMQTVVTYSVSAS